MNAFRRTAVAGVLLCLLLSGCKSHMMGAKNTVSEDPYVALRYLGKARAQDPLDQSIDRMAKFVCKSHKYRIENGPKYSAPLQTLQQYDRYMALKAYGEGYLGIGVPPLDLDVQRLRRDAAENYYEKAVNAYKLAKESGRHEKYRATVHYVDCCRALASLSTKDPSPSWLRKQALLRALSRLQLLPADSSQLARRYVSKVDECVGGWSPRFLEFVDSRATADGKCTVEVDDRFSDSGWVTKHGRNTEEVEKEDDDGNEYTVKYHAKWTIKERTQTLRLSVRYDVQTNRSGLPSPSGSVRTKVGWGARWDDDEGAYLANWSGDEEALPWRIANMDTTPPQPPGRLGLLDKCDGLARRLADKMFSDYEYH